MAFGKAREVKCPYQALSRVMGSTRLRTVGGKLDRVVVRLFYSKVALFPSFPYCPIWSRVTLHRSHVRGGQLTLCILEARVSRLFGIFL